ncbi:MAG TPA: hypothetical protein VKP10_09245 [Gemmatimonadales bacterium]|nr:hypothetical protein [Gemmatimonadales bacterium]
MPAPRRSRFLVAAFALAVACGEGRLIFDVDVFSFLQGVGQDSLPYLAPSPLPDTIPVQQVNGLVTGLGSSVVESVTVSGAVDFVNATGTGTVGLKIYFDTVPALYADTPAVIVVPVNVTPGATSSTPFQGTVPAVLNQRLLNTTIYVGMRALATATSGTVAGKAHLTALRLRIVVQDKLVN